MKKKRKKYDCTFKKKAVLLSYKRNSVGKLEKELNLYRGALTQWRKEYKKSGLESFQENNDLQLNLEKRKNYYLKMKIKQSDLKLEFLKRAGQHLSLAQPHVFKLIQDNEKTYSIRLMCLVLNVHKTHYYKWKNKKLTETEKRKILLKQEIFNIFYAAKCRYGSMRIAVVLQNSGFKISMSTLKKYMREMGLSDHVKKN